jgi:hypothetical protein
VIFFCSKKGEQMKNVMSIMLLFLGMTIAGCAGAPKHPGAYNSFDSTTADYLSDTQSVLEGLSSHVNDYPKALQPLNDARAAYTVLKNDYLLWRCTVGITQTLGPNGAPCPAGVNMPQSQVQQDQAKTQQAVAAAQSAENGGQPAASPTVTPQPSASPTPEVKL